MNVNSYKEKLLEVWEELPPIFVTSAERGTGEQELVSYIEQINREIANQG
jgi:GTP-binding protein